MNEELNVKQYQVRGVYKNLYKYRFPNDNTLGKHDLKKSGYKGQKQSLLIVELTGQEEDIRVNYWDHRSWKFVKEKDLIKTLHHYRQEAAKIYLNKLNDL